MTEKQSGRHFNPPKSLTRRVFLPWLIVGVGGLNAGLIWAFRRSTLAQPPKPGKKPYFRKWKIQGRTPDAAPGLYLNPKSQIIHYIPEPKRPRFTGGINAQRFQPIGSPDLINLVKSTASPAPESKRTAGVPRVNRKRASYSFEQAAVSELKQNNVDRACELLLLAIQFDQQQHPRRKWSPSLRLYDLLAGVAVRFNKIAYLQAMATSIQNAYGSDAQTKFGDRLKKWHDPQSRWYVRWTNRSQQMEWKVDQTTGLVF